MTWDNKDGLLVRFGTERSEVAPDGVALAHEHYFVLDVDNAVALTDADTAAEAGDRPFIPAGAVIKDAFFEVTTAFTSGGSAVLDLGTKELDGTTIDDDGIDAAIAVAALTAGVAIISDGALIGTRVAVDSYPTATFDTAAFTAGAGRLVIKFVKQ